MSSGGKAIIGASRSSYNMFLRTLFLRRGFSAHDDFLLPLSGLGSARYLKKDLDRSPPSTAGSRSHPPPGNSRRLRRLASIGTPGSRSVIVSSQFGLIPSVCSRIGFGGAL